MRNNTLKIIFIIALFFLVIKVNAKEVTCDYSGDLSLTVTMKSETNITYSDNAASAFSDLFKSTYKDNADCPPLYASVVPSPDPLAARTYRLSSTSGNKLFVEKKVIGDDNKGNNNLPSPTKPAPSSNKVRAVCEYGTSSDNLNVEYTIDYDFSNDTYTLNTSYKHIGHLITPKMSDEKTFVNAFKNGNTLKCIDYIYTYNSQGTWTIYATKQGKSYDYIFNNTYSSITKAPTNEVPCISKYGTYYVTSTTKRFVSSLTLSGSSSLVVDNTTMNDFKSDGTITCPTMFYYVQNHGPSSTEYMVYGPVSKPPIEFGYGGLSTKMYSQAEINDAIRWYQTHNGNNGPSGPIDCNDFVTKEGVNIIADLFNIIMIVGPILALVLGSIDFAKATLASDENALKKAGTNFTKRIIAAILLFLLPLIINLVLGIAFGAGVFEGMRDVPQICLKSTSQ